jgi:hypothetical protein
MRTVKTTLKLHWVTTARNAGSPGRLRESAGVPPLINLVVARRARSGRTLPHRRGGQPESP